MRRSGYRRDTYRRRTPRKNQQLLETRAPRRGTLIVSAVLYVVGLFGYLDWFPISDDLAVGMLALAGGLLMLGALMRDL